MLLIIGVLMLILEIIGITYVANNYGRCSNDHIIFIACVVLAAPSCIIPIVLEYIL